MLDAVDPVKTDSGPGAQIGAKRGIDNRLRLFSVGLCLHLFITRVRLLGLRIRLFGVRLFSVGLGLCLGLFCSCLLCPCLRLLVARVRLLGFRLLGFGLPGLGSSQQI